MSLIPNSVWPTGEELRDAGMAQAASGAAQQTWFNKARVFVINKPHGWEDISEAWRVEIMTGPIGPPPRGPNVWGALTNSLQRGGIIVKTGERRKMTMRTSHARMTDVWRRV